MPSSVECFMNWDRMLMTPLWLIDLLKDHTAALMVNQMFYRGTDPFKPYYKFLDVPEVDTPLYLSGDSWCEELCMTPRQFKNLRKKVATKLKDKPAVSVLQRKFDERGALLPVNHLVYWWYYPSNRISFYLPNHTLYNAYHEIYSERAEPLRDPQYSKFDLEQMQKFVLPQYQNGPPIVPNGTMDIHKMSSRYQENTQRTTEKYKKPAPDGARRNKPLYQAVGLHHFGIALDAKCGRDEAARIGKVVKVLEQYEGIAPDDVELFAAWWRGIYPSASLPRDAGKCETHYRDFMASRHDRARGESERRRVSLDDIS